MIGDKMETSAMLPCLIVGAGPTGLTLATQLRSFGTPFRIVDRSRDRARESRALAVQARTLEILDAVGLADAMVALGRTSTRVVIHLDGIAHVVEIARSKAASPSGCEPLGAPKKRIEPRRTATGMTL
jgi:2-polyprenyl-6-methoxyphenol hydroxylase-like FAD-dependent oxidoreductase